MTFDLAKYLVDHPENSPEQIMEAFLKHQRDARQAAGITVIGRNAGQIYEYPMPLHHPFVDLWKASLGKYVQTEVSNKILPNHLYTGLTIRSTSLNAWDRTMTVVVAIKAGSRPTIEDPKCVKLVARLQEHIQKKYPSVTVVMEEF